MYGMPMCGTPIGLAGPPHIPLGVPAGLQGHVNRPTTPTCRSRPGRRLDIGVKQVPGLSYPKPPHHVVIVEATPTPPVKLHQPCVDRHQMAPGYYDGSCPEGGCPTGNCPSGNCQPDQQ